MHQPFNLRVVHFCKKVHKMQINFFKKILCIIIFPHVFWSADSTPPSKNSYITTRSSSRRPDKIILSTADLKKLHRAIKNNDLQELRTLLKAGASVNAQDLNGSTIIMSAICHKNCHFAEELLIRGACLDHATYSGKTVYDVAKEHNSNMIFLLQAFDALKKVHNPKAFSREPKLSDIVIDIHAANNNDVCKKLITDFLKNRQQFWLQELHYAYEQFKKERMVNPLVAIFMCCDCNHTHNNHVTKLYEIAECFKSSNHIKNTFMYIKSRFFDSNLNAHQIKTFKKMYSLLEDDKKLALFHNIFDERNRLALSIASTLKDKKNR